VQELLAWGPHGPDEHAGGQGIAQDEIVQPRGLIGIEPSHTPGGVAQNEPEEEGEQRADGGS
jgi:hypothetical protein